MFCPVSSGLRLRLGKRFGLWRGWYDWSSDGSLSLDGGITLSAEKVEMASDHKVRPLFTPILRPIRQKKKGHLLFIDGEPLCFFRGNHHMRSPLHLDFIVLACRSYLLALALANGRWWCRKYCRGRDRPA